MFEREFEEEGNENESRKSLHESFRDEFMCTLTTAADTLFLITKSNDQLIN